MICVTADVWQLNRFVKCLCSNLGTPVRRLSMASLPDKEEEEPVLLPPPDYSDDTPPSPVVSSAPTPQNVVSGNI